MLRDQWVTGTYWERHDLPKPHAIPERFRRRVENLPQTVIAKPWRTVRDAIFDLRRLRIGEADETDPNHYRTPGARAYQGHTGSPIDEPAKTLKAGDHGVPGGENTLAIPDGRVRYFSVREAARLQSFPDSYWFSGAWTERMRQVGNAVPVELAQAVASEVRNHLP